ncbi:MAG TPA: RNA pseudouridine synthase [Thermoanaerobaculia bacterium]|nr:RNA pseudouridine synthase [Thermoanaerobaculia bacterium]
MSLPLLPSPKGAGDYVAVDKPAGRSVHGKGGLLDDIRRELGEDVHLVHRLDKETSGVLLLARGAEALKAAHAAWPASVAKVYVARTRGVPEPAEGVIDRPLLEHRTGKPELLSRALRAAYGPSRAGHLLAGRRVLSIPPVPPPGRTAAHPAGRPAETAYRVLKVEGQGASRTALVALEPKQGRMHQLRVHLASIGTPILGDAHYDPGRAPSDPPPFLHALRLTWSDPPGAPPGSAWTWESPAPGLRASSA